MRALTPFNLQRRIEQHRQLLEPPVSSQRLLESSDYVVTVFGGPRARKDFHDAPGEEIFHQLEGDVILATIQDGRRVNVPIRQGETLLLPAHVPHSPQRFAGTVGLVLERRRRAGEADGYLWYCERCDTRLYAEYLAVSDPATDLPPVFDRFWGNAEHATCSGCGTVLRK